MTTEEYKQAFIDDSVPGWDAIDAQLGRIYGAQKPQHYAPPLHYIAGGNDPLDGISVYQSASDRPHRHFVSYGLSSLYYDEEAAGKDFSKWGFELTFRLAPFAGDADCGWVLNLLQNLARYVFESGRWFEAGHFIPTNGPIRVGTDTDITAIAFTTDPELGMIDTPHGEVTFLQAVGITAAEYQRLLAAGTTTETNALLRELKKTNPLLITNLSRRN